MKEFTKTLKLYFHRQRGMASLSIRSSLTHVLTFYVEKETFEKILTHYRDSNGIETGPYFVQKKSDYIRFSFSHPQGPQENLRVPIVAWESLIQDFRRQMTATSDDLITCEAD